MPTALIVGAGVGGLAAALALRQAGWDVEIHERVAAPSELGFALMLAPNAMIALGKLGIAERIAAAGFIAERGEIRTAGGVALRRVDLGAVHLRLGAKTVCALRTVLHGTLMEAVGPAALRLGSRAVGFTAEPRGVALALEGGATRRGRILVGADGVQSAIRRALHPDEPAPRPSGLLAVRGLARGARALLADLGSAIYYGTGWEAGTVRAGGDDVYWFVSIRIERAGEGEGEGEGAAGDPRAPLAPILDSLHAPFRDMIAATDVRDLRADVLLEREPLAAWGGGAATLLGDAAHPMLPHAGQGAAQAIEDAVALGEAMAAATDPESGLRAYERARIPRTSAVVRLARSNARIGTLDNPLACALRNLAIRLAPERLILKRQIDVAQPGRES